MKPLLTYMLHRIHVSFHINASIYAVIIVGLSQLMYDVTEGPLETVSVCVTIELGSLGSDVSVILMTPVTGSTVIGKSSYWAKVFFARY